MTKKMYIWCIVWCWVTAYKYSDRRNNHIIEKIYVHKKLPIICSKLIFRGLLVKLAAKVTFEFNSRSFKQGHYGRTTICYFYQHLYGEKEKWYCNTIKIFFRKFVDAIFWQTEIRRQCFVLPMKQLSLKHPSWHTVPRTSPYDAILV